MKTRLTLLTLGVSLVALFGLSACSPESPQAPQQGEGQMPPPPPVTVTKVSQQEVVEWKEFTGRLEASKSIVVKPRTSGYIVEVGFEDGTEVKKGDLLFQVDYRTIAAEVEQLKADLKRVEAEIELAQRALNRAESLRATNALSQEQLDTRRTELTQARAQADSVRSDLQRSKVLLAITRVQAEFDGRVSNARVKVGSSVVAGDTVLTTLVATDQIHAYFDVDEPTYLKLKAQGFDYRSRPISVRMGLANQHEYPYEGRIDFVDNQVDSATGTIRMRAVYDNAADELTPGLFARVRLQVSEASEETLIPEKAIATDLSSKYVLVVGENNIVNYRPVELGARRGDMRIIKSGVTAGETIIISGLQRAFPGAPVTPQPADKAGDNAANAQ